MLAYYTHNLDPFLVRFGESFGIRYYGVAYVLGFLSAAWLLQRYYKKGLSPLNPDRVWDLIVAIVIGVMVGGRVGYFLLYEPEFLTRDPLKLFRVWEGGMASHGGFVGVAVALAIFGRLSKTPFLLLGDLIASTAPLGLFFGRLANFINGELWGKMTTVKWAVIFPESPHPLVPRHPSQLYEAALEGLLLLALVQWRIWKTDTVSRSPGRLSGEFLIAYAAVRAVGEVFREPDQGVSPIWHLSRGTFYSLFLVVAGLALIAISLRKKKAPQEGA